MILLEWSVLVVRTVYYLDFLMGCFEMNLISLLVVLAAMTKSAQIPFSF
jgi:NADH:ubiquinone oxidoreductase subunit 5 (subunit L)/multisubunit Na+/H+ antiporter MnhA subunit